MPSSGVDDQRYFRFFVRFFFTAEKSSKDEEDGTVSPAAMAQNTIDCQAQRFEIPDGAFAIFHPRR
jgi:hypothetical protein